MNSRSRSSPIEAPPSSNRVVWGEPIDVYDISVKPIVETDILDDYTAESVGWVVDGDLDAFLSRNRERMLQVPTEFGQFFGEYPLNEECVLDAGGCELAVRLLADGAAYDPREFAFYELEHAQGGMILGDNGAVFIAPTRAETKFEVAGHYKA